MASSHSGMTVKFRHWHISEDLEDCAGNNRTLDVTGNGRGGALAAHLGEQVRLSAFNNFNYGTQPHPSSNPSPNPRMLTSSFFSFSTC